MSKKKNLLLISPHSDDIIFSASYFLFNRKKYNKVRMLTVEYDEKRLEEDRKLCQMFDMELITLKSKIDSKGFHKEYYSTRKKLDDESAYEFCLSKLGNKKMSKLIKSLDKILDKYSKSLIVTCAGIGHPFHCLITILTSEKSDLFYRDFPHSYKRRNQEYYNLVLQDTFEPKFEFFDKESHEKKFDIVKQIYKSQSSLLFFEKRYIEKLLPEEFYEKK